MIKKRILVDGYIPNNFGDDLFFYNLVNNAKDIEFIFIDGFENNFLKHQENVTFIRNKDLKLKELRKYDEYVMIGGSLFQETDYWKKQFFQRIIKIIKFKMMGLKLETIGFNFGPYKSKLFLFCYKIYFRFFNVLTVRDDKSYKLLKKNKNIRKYPDIAFQTNVPNINKEDILGISVMDFGSNDTKQKIYERALVDLLEKMPESRVIRLFSFQNSASINDSQIINRILKKISKRKIEVIIYDGNLDDFLMKFGQCNYMITSRFHSLVLSLLFNQPRVIINYNEKITNLYMDLNLDSAIYKVSDLKCNEDFFNDVDLMLHDKVSSGLDNNFTNKAKEHLKEI